MRFMLPAYAARLRRLSGWRRAVAATIAGLLATLALPPVHAIPLLWLSVPMLLVLLDGTRNARAAFAVGWWFGFGHFSAGVYWIGYAMVIDAARFAWMIPFAVFGLGAYLALFTAAAVVLVRQSAPAGAPRVLALAFAWTLMEWVRGWMLTGFPWNLIASTWLPVTPVLQFAAIAGAYGLGTLTILCAGMPALLLVPSPRLWPLSATLLSQGLLLGVAIWGAWRLPAGPLPLQDGIRLRLVQANIEETLKWAPGTAALHLSRYLALSRSPGFDQVTAVIWPETALPYIVAENPAVAGPLATAVPPGGLLLTGTVREGLAAADNRQPLFNSLQIFDAHGLVDAGYDKVHLVPFGEYVPLRRWLPLAKLTPGGTDYEAGPGPTTLHLPGLPAVTAMICFDSIFPAAAASAERPAWLLNITNDAWFGVSAGPYQHLAAARLRAVEQGLPLVRVANTGISAMIDPYGRIAAVLPLATSGILDVQLPRPLPMTIYGRFQHQAGVTILILRNFAHAINTHIL